MAQNSSIEIVVPSPSLSAIIGLSFLILLGHGLGRANAAGVGAQIPTTPFISPVSGTYAKGLSITISDGTPGTTIYYTTDGSAPTVASQQYIGPISIPTALLTKTIRAFPSRPASTAPLRARLSPSSRRCRHPLSPSQGSYMNPQSVSLLGATPGVVIHYTLDGTPPTTNSPVYGDSDPCGATYDN